MVFCVDVDAAGFSQSVKSWVAHGVLETLIFGIVTMEKFEEDLYQ